MTVVSYEFAKAFNRSGATRAVALDISKTSNRVWHAGLLHKLKAYGISSQVFGLISSFLSNRWLICNITLYADDTTLCSKCDQASDLW